MVAACFTSTPALGAPGSAQLSTASDESGYGQYGGRGKAAYCGRGGANKDPFVVAVETTAEGRRRRVLRHLVERDDSVAIETMAREHIVAGTHVVSDGLGCFRAVTRAGATHTPIVAAREAEQSEKIPALKWVNTILGNLKTAIA